MADTQQGIRQQSARDTGGTTDTYNGDLRALFEAVATVPAGSTYNEAFILWLQAVTGSSESNVNDLAALFASQQSDVYNWSSAGELFAPPDDGSTRITPEADRRVTPEADVRIIGTGS